MSTTPTPAGTIRPSQIIRGHRVVLDTVCAELDLCQQADQLSARAKKLRARLSSNDSKCRNDQDLNETIRSTAEQLDALAKWIRDLSGSIDRATDRAMALLDLAEPPADIS